MLFSPRSVHGSVHIDAVFHHNMFLLINVIHMSASISSFGTNHAGSVHIDDSIPS